MDVKQSLTIPVGTQSFPCCKYFALKENIYLFIKEKKLLLEDITMTNIISKHENEPEIQHLIKQLGTEKQREKTYVII